MLPGFIIVPRIVVAVAAQLSRPFNGHVFCLRASALGYVDLNTMDVILIKSFCCHILPSH
jgi:hypothetical protein